MSAYHDHWLLPTRQCDYPGLDPVPDNVLHARREGTFLVLATLAFTATLVAPIATGWLDIAAVLRRGLPFASVVPLGVLALPLAIAATILVSELYGHRRGVAFALAVAVASMAVASVVGFTPVAIAIAIYAAVVHIAGSLVFDALRLAHGRLFWVRALVATLFAQLVGWAAFAGVLLVLGTDRDATINVATAGIIYASAGAIAVAIPLGVAKRVLGAYLRVAGLSPIRVRRVKPEASDRVEVVARSGRFARASIQPYSSAEMQFFIDGDKLTDDTDVA